MRLAEHYFSEQPTSPPRMGLLRCRLLGHDFEFLTASGVFSHTRLDAGTRLLIEAMMLPASGEALDLGCGYGPIGIAAAKLEPRLMVWMTDVNRRAVALAEENVRRNGVGNVRVLTGFLYEPLEGRSFEVILTNPPISAGIAGAVGPLIEGSAAHLNPGGSLQMVVRTAKGGRSVAGLLEKHYGGFEVLARRGGYRVLRAERSREPQPC